MPIAIRSGSTVPDPTSPPEPPTDQWGAPVRPIERPGLAGMTWTGTDGSVWDLLRPESGVFLMNGATGLTPEAYTPMASKTGVHGQVQRGGRWDARNVLWPVHLFHDGSSQEFVDRYSAWWRSFPYDLTWQPAGVWEVTAPNGTKRRMRLRLEDAGDNPEFDPTMRGWATFASKLVADLPFWEGDPESLTWGAAMDGHGSFLRPSKGVLRISRGFTVDQAVITNPGDVDAWPVWTVRGPWLTVSLGVNGRVVNAPFGGVEGDVLVVDTQAATAHLNGVEVSHRLSSWEWAPVPPGQSVPLTIRMDGNGSVTAELTPLHLRAFG